MFAIQGIEYPNVGSASIECVFIFDLGAGIYIILGKSF